MKNLPIRLENAITKLYAAFHNGELQASNCTMCAVGNICDNSMEWANKFGHGMDTEMNVLVQITSYNYGYRKLYSKNGYSGLELHTIEKLFLESMIGLDITLKETQFKGLCAVVEYLCELDNIPNVMDYTKLFETENNQPKYQLS